MKKRSYSMTEETFRCTECGLLYTMQTPKQQRRAYGDMAAFYCTDCQKQNEFRKTHALKRTDSGSFILKKLLRD